MMPARPRDGSDGRLRSRRARSAASQASLVTKPDLKIPPHLESVVEVNRDEAEVWGSSTS
jgi:hypothetical protein